MAVSSSPAGEETRFAFGENWRDFVASLTPQQFDSAKESMVSLVGSDDLGGRSFLDVGSGSGLMSLVAHQLGARVTAFDYDADAVETTAALRDRELGTEAFPALQGSVLDEDFVRSLGHFDVVYAWGVLHHTGNLWAACANVARAVAPGGLLAVAIYNDQGWRSRAWRRVKRTYAEGTKQRRQVMLAAATALFGGLHIVRRGVRALTAVRHPSRDTPPRPRGMDRRHDLVDWIGGYPFEVAAPEQAFEFFRSRGFTLERLTTCGGRGGCNEFLFRRAS
jgi:2-polyprenyl-3-methyl-5-hydroxy-6-metoxy-1,4-benzoquinol methylase